MLWCRAVPTTTPTVVGDLSSLVGDFERSLRARNRAPRTVAIYGNAARTLVAWLQAQGMPTAAEKVGREHLEAFVADQLSRYKPATASQRYRALAQWFKWLTAEGEIRSDPFARMKPPTVPEAPVPVLSDADLVKLIKACEPGRRPEGRVGWWQNHQYQCARDEALLRLLIDCGVRCSEVMNLTTEDVDREAQIVFVVGKGRRPRQVPYGHRTGQAVDRYLRLRNRRPDASLPWLWLGSKGRFTDWGLRQMLNRRAAQAGVGHVYPHQFRHTGAHRWLAAGGGETDLMRLMGWKSRQMLGRYGASAADERAREAHRRMGLGDLI